MTVDEARPFSRFALQFISRNVQPTDDSLMRSFRSNKQFVKEYWITPHTFALLSLFIIYKMSALRSWSLVFGPRRIIVISNATYCSVRSWSLSFNRFDAKVGGGSDVENLPRWSKWCKTPWKTMLLQLIAQKPTRSKLVIVGSQEINA